MVTLATRVRRGVRCSRCLYTPDTVTDAEGHDCMSAWERTRARIEHAKTFHPDEWQEAQR